MTHKLTVGDGVLKMDIKANSIELIDIDSIIENPKNANRHPIEQIQRLEKLIKFQGFRNPLIISKRTGFLVAGHGRLVAAKNLGMTKVPVVYQDFENEAQEYAYVVSDNEIARWAELDKQLVYDSLVDIPELDIDMLGIDDFSLFDFGKVEEEEIEQKENENKKFILKIELPNEMEMHDLKDDLISKGYNVRVEGEK